MTIAKIRPIVHARIVETGIEGSSVFATAERTSGYGESSSNTAASLSKLGSSNAGIGTLSICSVFMGFCYFFVSIVYVSYVRASESVNAFRRRGSVRTEQHTKSQSTSQTNERNNPKKRTIMQPFLDIRRQLSLLILRTPTIPTLIARTLRRSLRQRYSRRHNSSSLATTRTLFGSRGSFFPGLEEIHERARMCVAEIG